MAPDLRQQAQWAQLPGNLWATIFSCHHPGTVNSLTPCSRPWESTSSQEWFLWLRTVCQAFDEVFEEHHLPSSILIGDQVQSCDLPILVDWLRYRHTSIKTIKLSQSSPWVETTLAALQSPNTSLGAVHLAGSNIPDTAMLMLSSFRTITQCAFDAPKPGVVNLQPLQGLPRLTKLTLINGNFTE